MEVRAQTAEEFDIIERIARVVSSVRGTKTDYTYLAAELEQAVPFDIFGVVLLRHDRQALRITVCQRDEDGWVPIYHQHPLADSRLEKMLRVPVLTVRDYPAGLDGSPGESGDALSGYHHLRSTLIVPLVVGDRVLGDLELGSIVPGIYAHPNLQRLVGAVAQMLATAIESAQLGGNTEIQDRQRRALKDVTSALTEKMDLGAILQQIVVGISDTLNVSSCICLWDRRTGLLHLEALAGLDRTAFASAFGPDRLVTDTCILGQALLRRQSLVSSDIVQDGRFPACRELFGRMRQHSVLAHPLVTGAAVYGVLFLCSPEAGGFTPLKIDILSLFANQATIAIHNGMLLESVHHRNRFQLAIEQLEQAYHRHSDVEEGRDEGALEEELALLANVRAATQEAFGISFSSFLRFISDYLLTQSERNLQAHTALARENPTEKLAGLLETQADVLVGQQTQEPSPFSETLSLLAETAESALTRAGMVGELGRLLMQLKQSASGVRDAWFMVDLNGMCTYINPAAETLCDVRLEAVPVPYEHQLLAPSFERGQSSSLKIEDVFTKLFPRMRNAEEVVSYLHDFSQGSTYRQELRCIIAVEPIMAQSSTRLSPAMERRMVRPESVPADNHYQFIRYPLYNQPGQLAAYALQVQDITEQMRDEKNRSALLSSVSHDLRTPLTTIKAAVSGLLQREIPWSEEDRQEMLEDINHETDHLTLLVNALVELSRIEMGALTLEREWCDVVEVLHGALTKLESSLINRDVRINVQSSLPLIYADHVQLERVFYNLLENAIEHSPPDTPIDILLDAFGERIKMLRGRVIDYGEGVPEHERERIFKSFYSLLSYRNGMGLAICRGIIEAHQGQIQYDPYVAKGSCFVFTVPTHPHTVLSATGETLASEIGKLQ